MAAVLHDVVGAAKRAVDLLQDRANGGLNFSELSLSIVEDMLAEASAQVDDMAESQIASLVELLGCYVLEVARMKYGGQYAWIDPERGPVLILGEPDTHIAIATWTKVRGRLNGDAGDNIPFFYQGFSEMASALPLGKRVLFI